MKRRKPGGPVLTLADACDADYLVILTCARCARQKQMHPYRLIGAHRNMAGAPLDTPLPGFFCTLCRTKVSVNITCTYTHPGGWRLARANSACPVAMRHATQISGTATFSNKCGAATAEAD